MLLQCASQDLCHLAVSRMLRATGSFVLLATWIIKKNTQCMVRTGAIQADNVGPVLSLQQSVVCRWQKGQLVSLEFNSQVCSLVSGGVCLHCACMVSLESLGCLAFSHSPKTCALGD